MAWYDEAVFYHIYPLGLTGAPRQNAYGEPVHRLNGLVPWIDHLRRLGFTALYIGPLFQSVGHGYETTDYRTLDCRLGTNDDLAAFVRACHEAGIRVVFDGVFNHTGRDFFAFRDLREHREASPYRDWYCNVNFWGNNEYGDGFSYDTWGGYDLLAKLNQRNPVVRDYLCDVVRFWVEAFDVDGIRLDAADVLDFDLMRALRQTADEAKPDFWLMGEVIHGDYARWANERTLHSVTDYALHKAFFSAHNDHNYFEIAHTVRRMQGMVGGGIRLYDFVDNHDVERISTKLRDKAHYLPVHVLLYTLPGIPSVYYGSEFGIEGRKERFSDDSLRPRIDLAEHAMKRALAAALRPLQLLIVVVVDERQAGVARRAADVVQVAHEARHLLVVAEIHPRGGGGHHALRAQPARALDELVGARPEILDGFMQPAHGKPRLRDQFRPRIHGFLRVRGHQKAAHLHAVVAQRADLLQGVQRLRLRLEIAAEHVLLRADRREAVGYGLVQHDNVLPASFDEGSSRPISRPALLSACPHFPT